MTTPGLLLVTAAIAVAAPQTHPCKPRAISEDKIVCVCDAAYCDTLPPPQTLPEGEYLTYASDRAGLRFESGGGKFEDGTFYADALAVKIEAETEFQTIEGFGGAFTDATGINVVGLSEGARGKLLEAYFSGDGIGYSLCRVPIGGTDFSTHGYSYDDGEADPQLANFNLTFEDHTYKIPLIKKALELSNNTLKLLASAWTAPKWMKTNGEYSGFLGFLKEEYYQTWVDYFLKFFYAYDAEGLSFWGLTTGNEPSLALLPFKNINSVGWTYWQLQKWVSENLGPTIRGSKYSDLKIMALDDQVFFLPWFVELLFQNETVKDYVDGIAVHWYWDKYLPSTLLTKTHNKFPKKFLIGTEASVGDKPWEQQTDLGSWSRAEDYASDIIRDLNHWFIGWIDWNMAVDLKGGPTYIENYVDSPVMVNVTADEFYKQPMFYALGHFSKFIPRGSIRVKTEVNDYSGVEVVAVKRPDNATTVVVLNKNSGNVTLVIEDERRGKLPITVTSKSITTLLYQ